MCRLEHKIQSSLQSLLRFSMEVCVMKGYKRVGLPRQKNIPPNQICGKALVKYGRAIAQKQAHLDRITQLRKKWNGTV